MSPTPQQENISASAASANGKKPRKPRFKKVEHEYPVEPRIIQVVKKPKTFVDHSYRDFSQVPADVKFQNATKIEDMSFAEKVFDILSDEKYSNWIQWLPHGRSFHIAVPKRLEQSQVLLKYFGHNRYSSFLRQLNNHGFKHITRGPDRNSYYHECFLRGMNHLLKYMPPGRDARRLMPDPNNEPDLYAISRIYPLPEVKNNNNNSPSQRNNMVFSQQVLDNAMRTPRRQPTPLPLGFNAAAATMQNFQNSKAPRMPSSQAQFQPHQQPNLDFLASLLNVSNSQGTLRNQGMQGSMNNNQVPSVNSGNCLINQGMPQLDDNLLTLLLQRSQQGLNSGSNNFLGPQS